MNQIEVPDNRPNPVKTILERMEKQYGKDLEEFHRLNQPEDHQEEFHRSLRKTPRNFS